MSDRKRERSRSPGGRRNGHRRGRPYGDDQRDPRRGLKQILSHPADPRNWRGREAPEERAVDLCRTITSRGYLDGGRDTEELATLMVEAAASFSMHTSVYATATALCVTCARSVQPPRKHSRDGRDGDEGSEDAEPPDDSVEESLEVGRSFGRLVVDGCCQQFAEALNVGGFIRAKLLLRFIGELVNCGLVQAQEYGDLLSTLCASYVMTEHHSDVKQPCRDMMASMVLSGVLRAGSALSKAWVGGFSDLMDDLRAFMAGRQAPFRHNGLRAMFLAKEDESDEEKQENADISAGESRPPLDGTEPMEDSLASLWDVVSAIHDNGWQEDDLPRAILRLWKKPLVEERLANVSSLSLPDIVVAADTISTELTTKGPFEFIACCGVNLGDGIVNPSYRPDWSYTLEIMGEKYMFDEDDGAGPASCCPDLLPKKERVVLVECFKDTLACFQPLCRLDGTKVGKWANLADQMFSVSEVAPDGCHLAYLVTEVLFMAMLQVPAPEHLIIACHRTILELCRAVPKEVPAAVSYCTGRLFDELENLDTSVAARFGTWFADHLKNTEYKWPFWKHWCNVVESDPGNAQRVFVTNVLAALVKFSYAERIKKTLPEALWPLMPLDPSPVYPYLDDAVDIPSGLRRVAAELSSRINNREESRHLQDWLEEEHDLRDTQDGQGGQDGQDAQDAQDGQDEQHAQDGQDGQHAQDGQDTTEDANAIAVDPSWRANMLIQVILHAGHASPTHAFVYLDRYHDYLKSLSGNEASGEANQVAMLDGIAQLWQNSPQLFCLVCRHLLGKGVLGSLAVVQYFFREDNVNEIAVGPFLWEVLSRAIGLYMNRVRLSLSLLGELEEKEKQLCAEPAASSDKNDISDAAPPASTAESEKILAQEMVNKERVNARDMLSEAQAVCRASCSGFVQALANAAPQYAANGIEDFALDPWWVSMTSYLRASLWLFAAAPRVPRRCLPEQDEASGIEHVLDIDELEVMAADAGCKEYIEGIISDLWSMR